MRKGIGHEFPVPFDGLGLAMPLGMLAEPFRHEISKGLGCGLDHLAFAEFPEYLVLLGLSVRFAREPSLADPNGLAVFILACGDIEPPNDAAGGKCLLVNGAVHGAPY